MHEVHDDVLTLLRGAEERADSNQGTKQQGVAGWPEPLASEAMHGLAGEIVSTIEPHSEADPVALLVHLLVSFGSMIGRNPHFCVGGTQHHTNLNAVHVGATASRKGTAGNDCFFVIRTVDPEWVDRCVQSGLSSGEGLIWAVRDAIEEQQAIKEKGRVVDYQNVVVDPGVTDKRLLLVEPEFGSTLRVLEREGNTLSAQIRQGWDSGNIRVLTKNKAARATDAHISIIGHVTREELLKYLNQTEQANGFANRILWVAVRRSQLLPDGGDLQRIDLDGIRSQLQRSVSFARHAGEMQRSAASRDIWHAIYGRLAGDRLGLFGAVTNRAEAQTLRLAMIYALLDGSKVIDPQHLNAALAVWSYCEASARFIFGEAVGNATADEILRLCRINQSGSTRTELVNHFGRNKSAADIGLALDILVSHGLIRKEMEPTAGRPAERWFARNLGTKETKLTKEVRGGAA